MEETRPEEATPFPEQGRLLGIDFGTKRLGFSISTPDQSIASPLENYTRGNEQQDQRKFKTIIDEYQVAGIVIGLPVHMSGEESQKSQESRAFGKWVAEFTLLPIIFWDERFTTSRAEEILQAAELTKKQRKARLDKLASQLMLQSFLDSPNRNQPPLQY